MGNDDDEAEVARIERDLRKAARVSRARERVREGQTKDNVVACRLDNGTLAAVDTLVEAGVRSTRADAAAWLISVGLDANRELLAEITDTVTEIRQLRERAVAKARRFTTEHENTDPTSH